MRKTIIYDLELLSPVLATEVQSEPNGAVSMPYLSGALLRGALVTRYLQTSGNTAFDVLADRRARDLFFNETTDYLNAYPLDAEARRMLPLPAAWRFHKNDRVEAGKERTIYNLAHNQTAIPAGFVEEAVRDAFVSVRGETARLYSPPRQINIHTQRDAVKGRSTEDAGQVYRYDALAAGLRLQAAIMTSAELTPRLAALLEGARLWLGRARHAGYGQVVVTAVQVLDYWHELGERHETPAVAADTELQIVFTSDALLRDANGQPTLDAGAALAAKLQVDADALRAQPQACFVRAKVVGGFNRKWGLPLPQMTALAVGSVLTYQTSAAIGYETLEALERDGIGERRNEGFGRLVINWLSEPAYAKAPTEMRRTLPPLVALSAAERQLAEQLARRLLRQKLDAELLRKVNTTKIELPSEALNKHQLSRLRVILRDLEENDAGKRRWQDHLDSLQKRRSTRQQFARVHVRESSDEQPLLDWLAAKMENAVSDWQLEAVRLGDDKVFVEAPVDAALAWEYARCWIDGVLHRAAKESR